MSILARTGRIEDLPTITEMVNPYIFHITFDLKSHRPKDRVARFREHSDGKRPNCVGRRIGTRLYSASSAALAGEDVNRVLAGIAQPNDASSALARGMRFRRIGLLTEVGRTFRKILGTCCGWSGRSGSRKRRQ